MRKTCTFQDDQLCSSEAALQEGVETGSPTWKLLGVFLMRNLGPRLAFRPGKLVQTKNRSDKKFKVRLIRLKMNPDTRDSVRDSRPPPPSD